MAEHWLITGANRGIGAGLVKLILARGDDVTPAVRSRGALEESGAHGGSRKALVFDTRDEDSIAAAAASLDAGVDVLVCNAGIYGPQRQSTKDMDFAGVLDLLNVNTLGPLRTAQAFLSHLRRGKNPRIVFISSLMGSMALAGSHNVGYRASKAALNKIMQCMAEDLRESGVSLISMHPGWVRTDMGGSNATLSVEESVSGMVKVIDQLTLNDSGKFLDYQGKPVAW